MTISGPLSTRGPICSFQLYRVSQILDVGKHQQGTMHHHGTTPGFSDSNHYQVQLTALQKQAYFSFKPVNPDVQALQLKAKNKLKASLLSHME